MKLFEFEAKRFASEFGVPVPRGVLVSTPEEARSAAAQLGKDVAIKAQVLIAGRGKAGGIKFASNPEEAYDIAKAMLGSTIGGEKIGRLLVEEKLSIMRELYLGVVADRSSRCYSILGSREGGGDIEEVAERAPERIVKAAIDPIFGLRDYEAREVARSLGYVGRQLLDLASILLKLFRIAQVYDGELVESNPLVETPDGTLVAADVRMLIDDNALFRHAIFEKRMEEVELSPQEAKARKKGLSYVELEGDIGIIGNGAGLVMATLDMIKDYGGRPANFCDIGGGADPERISAALEIVLANEKVKVLFVNIMGGITRCDDVARGVIEAQTRIGIRKPMVIRMVGTNEEEGRRILAKSGIPSLDSMEEAAEKAVQLAKGKK